MLQAIAILGYNNTRIGEVRAIQRLARQMFGARTLLVKKSPTAEDQSVADYVADVDLDDHDGGADTCEMKSRELGIDIIAILPFSDRGVVIAAKWAKKKGLPGANPKLITTGLDKMAFRAVEAASDKVPAWYYRPAVKQIKSLADILFDIKTSGDYSHGCYVKPMKEGNSRGGSHVTDRRSAEAAFDLLRPYLAEGAISEEYLVGREFSSDSVGGMRWATEKETTTGRFRAEVQQIVPAPLPTIEYYRICDTGSIIGEMCGTPEGSARHIEVMLLDTNDGGICIGAIEPNLRPAGMKIWDLAEVAFGCSPWQEWLTWATGSPPSPSTMISQCYAGIRMIASTRDGEFNGVPDECVRQIRADFPAVFDIDITYPIGKRIRAEARDNSEFIGHVLAKHHDAEVLRNTLRQVCDLLSQNAKVLQ